MPVLFGKNNDIGLVKNQGTYGTIAGGSGNTVQRSKRKATISPEDTLMTLWGPITSTLPGCSGGNITRGRGFAQAITIDEHAIHRLSFQRQYRRLHNTLIQTGR